MPVDDGHPEWSARGGLLRDIVLWSNFRSRRGYRLFHWLEDIRIIFLFVLNHCRPCLVSSHHPKACLSMIAILSCERWTLVRDVVESIPPLLFLPMRFDRYLIDKITSVDEQQLAVETLPSPSCQFQIRKEHWWSSSSWDLSRIIFNALTHELHLSVWNRRYALWYMKINMFHNPWDSKSISLSGVLIAAQAANMSATKNAHVNMSARMYTSARLNGSV